MPADCEHAWQPIPFGLDGKRCSRCGLTWFFPPGAPEYVAIDVTVGSSAFEESVGEERVKARPPPDAAEALETLREFASVDVDEIKDTERFAADPWQYFRDAMVGLQVVVRAHLEALDAEPKRAEMTHLSLQVLLEVKAREYDEGKTMLNGNEYRATALREFARFLRESRRGGTSEGT